VQQNNTFSLGIGLDDRLGENFLSMYFFKKRKPMSIQNPNLTAGAASPALFPKILAIEPDFAIGEMLAELFNQSGYECKIVKECSNIIPLMKSFSPDLVLVEYLLPSVNGGELCTQVKSNSLFSTIPVIVYSAYPQILWSVEEYGCDEFLPKPFDIDELMFTVERLLVRGKERRRFAFLADTLKNRLSYLGKFLGGKLKVA
jgi:DNA-binding NtrC family response regulator